MGVTGIVGQAVARRLLDQGWEVHGLSRSGGSAGLDVTPVAVDLTDPEALAEAVGDLDPSLVAMTAWIPQDSEERNIEVNGALVRDLLNALGPARSSRHVALMTGLKHYLGPFEAYGSGDMPDSPFREEEPRLDVANFYYAQEDELLAGAQRFGLTWSVHRAHTVLGFATGNAMNMVATLAAYAALCRERGLPFVFPGSQTQWDGVTDVTDADLVAEQMIWAATDERGHDQAFNTANGDVFRWRWLWPQVAAHLGLEWEGFAGEPRPLEQQLAAWQPDQDQVWSELVERHDLVEPELTRVASWWHTDGDLGRPVEALTDMNKSRAAGFTATRDTRTTLLGYLDRYREARIVP